VELQFWKYANLKFPSCVRISKMTTISYLRLKKKIGEMHPDDLERVLLAIEQRYIIKMKNRIKEDREKGVTS